MAQSIEISLQKLGGAYCSHSKTPFGAPTILSNSRCVARPQVFRLKDGWWRAKPFSPTRHWPPSPPFSKTQGCY